MHQHPQRLIRKPKLLRSNPTRLSLIVNGNNFGFFIDDEGILSGYRTPRVIKPILTDDDLSDYVKLRLFLARELAIRRYHEKWG